MKRVFAFVASLLILGSATWMPSMVFAQAFPAGGGGSSSAAAPFSDATALVANASDPTKTFKVDPSGLTTGNAVVMTLTGTAAAPTWTATGWTLNVGSGSAAAPAVAWAADADGSGTGFYRNAADQITASIGGTAQCSFVSAIFRCGSTTHFGMSSGASTTAIDTGLRRLSAGVWTQTGATSSSIGALLGGGGAVASADPLPAFTGNVFHVTGTTSFTNFTTTNFVTGACATLIFDGVLTLTDGGNMKLSANFTTSADDTLTVCFDGTNFYEVARSVN